MTHRNLRGFTLVELSLVLALIALLTALAAPEFRGVLRRGRAVEARALMEHMADAQLRHFRDHGRYLPCAPQPAAVPRGTLAAFDAGAAGWRELAVRVEGGVRFQYEIVPSGRSFIVIARGDLDGDGKVSTLRLHGDTMKLDVEDELE